MILSVADRGTTVKDVGNAVHKIKNVYNKPIPEVDPKLLITLMCGNELQLPVRFERLAQGYVDVIKTKLPASCPPETIAETIAAVALVYTLSLTAANHCDQDILSRVSEASGVELGHLSELLVTMVASRKDGHNGCSSER